MAHTPGPWKVIIDNVGHNPDIDIAKDGHGFIASMGGNLPEARKADAYLMCAAPELIAAAKLAVAQIEDWAADQEWAKDILQLLRCAIAKAEGK